MKILIAGDLYWPVDNGVAMFSRNLARGLADRGHEVVVIAPSQTGKRSVEVDGNYTIYRTHSIIFPFYQNFRISLTPRPEVRRIIQDFKPDIIHIQMLMWIGQAAMLYGRRYDIPVVSTSHAMADNLLDNLKRIAPLSRPISYMLNDYGRRFHSRADVITAPTASGLKSFGEHVDKVKKPIRIISNGIDLAAFKVAEPKPEIYTKFGLPTNKPIVTYVGRVDAEKHLSVLVEAFRLVRQQVDAHLLIAGNGVDIDNLRELVGEYELESSVTFAGRVSEEDKIELEHVGTLYAMPSPFELQSIATLEAMASGQPVVAVDAGALAELCHDGQNGFLFDYDDYEQMAEAMVKILTDPKLRTKFSAESVRIASGHSLAATLDAFEKLYQEVIDDKATELAERPAGWLDRVKESDVAEYFRTLRGDD